MVQFRTFGLGLWLKAEAFSSSASASKRRLRSTPAFLAIGKFYKILNFPRLYQNLKKGTTTKKCRQYKIVAEIEFGNSKGNAETYQ